MAVAPPAAANDAAPPARLDFTVVASYPHDRHAYTQGLVYAAGALYESTGLYGRSTLRRVNLESGRPELVRELAPHLFGEGLTAFGDRLIQLTWRAGTALVYSRDDLRRAGELRYPTQGWGLTHDGRHLIMSDGSATLYFRDPVTFAELRRVEVRDDGGPVRLLNELEHVGGQVYANVYGSPLILRIDPRSGRVTGRVDLSPLVAESRATPGADVLNGIAYVPGSGRFLVTGKRWSRLYAVILKPAN